MSVRLVSLADVTRSRLRLILMCGLLVTAFFAAWTWLKPYAWKPDPASRCEVVGIQVRQDFQNYWVDVHLKLNSGETHDLMKPVRLITSDGRQHEPADTTLGAVTGQETTDLWFKFWLETADLEGPLKLRINDGELVIRSGDGLPSLGASKAEYFTTHRW